jgi:hypothetical protein
VLLLGIETRAFPGLPCAISVPNLIADRGELVACRGAGLNVRRLMYQTLIWLAVLGHEACGLGSARNAESLERLANPLVDGMRRDSELDRDLFRGKMLRDKEQAVELAARQFRHALRIVRFDFRGIILPKRGVRHPSIPFTHTY